jgi:RimJ/RimL family protein N-acetyltransferase
MPQTFHGENELSNPLSKRLSEGNVHLLPFIDDYIEPLREAYEQDQDIWEIYPQCMIGEYFDAGFGAFYKHYLIGDWVGFAIFDGEELVGLTNYIDFDSANGALEIGGTYIAPSVRGTGFNRTMKRLMIEHAFDCGYRRIELRVDARNKRSQAAVLKLGAQYEGTLRQNKITWTGHIRDTMVFSLFEDEWEG